MSIRARLTDNQRHHITKLVEILIELKSTPEASQYDHHHISTCTIGFAVKSQQFEFLNKHLELVDDNLVYVRDDSPYRAMSVSEVASKLFGHDYDHNVVFGGTDMGVYNHPPGAAQLCHVINFIIKRYKIDVNVVKFNTHEADNLRAKATGRVAELEELVKACDVLYKHSPLQEVKSIKDTSNMELQFLKNLLEK